MSPGFSTTFIAITLLATNLLLPGCVTGTNVNTRRPLRTEQTAAAIHNESESRPTNAPDGNATGLPAEDRGQDPAIEAMDGTHPDLEMIAIVGTNDLHGTLAPLELRTREVDGTPGTPYQAGGVAALAANVKLLRAEFKDRLLWLDGGDQFQGSIESNHTLGTVMVDFFNRTNLTASSIGNHEFDFGPEPPSGSSGPQAQSVSLQSGQDYLGVLKSRMKQAQYPYLGANILDRKTGLPTQELPNLYPSKIISAGRLKVGLIGVSTEETPSSSSYGSALGHLSFADPQWIVRAESARLREQGAQIILVVAHAGMSCQLGRAPANATLRKPHDLLGQCNETDELMKLLARIPEGMIDGVVSGHTHQLVHHWVNLGVGQGASGGGYGVPVIQAGAMGRYINVMYLTYSLAQKRVLHDRDRIEGPIPVCPKVFAQQKDCNGDRLPPEKGRGTLVTPRLHGKPVPPDRETEEWLRPVLEKFGPVKVRPVGKIAQRVSTNRTGESELGNFVADAIRLRAQAHLAIVNPGGLRAPWEAGTLTYEQLFRTLPFENTLAVLNLTGTEVQLLMQIVLSGHRGYFPFSGIRAKVLDLSSQAPGNDHNGNGRIDAWEVNRLLELTLSNGNPLQPEALYRVATLDFLVYGGDDLGWFMSRIPTNRKTLLNGVMIRDVVEKALAADSQLNSVGQPLILPNAPRLTLVHKSDPEPKQKSSKKRRKKRPR